jgi:hypothetical protein
LKAGMSSLSSSGVFFKASIAVYILVLASYKSVNDVPSKLYLPSYKPSEYSYKALTICSFLLAVGLNPFSPLASKEFQP